MLHLERKVFTSLVTRQSKPCAVKKRRKLKGKAYQKQLHNLVVLVIISNWTKYKCDKNGDKYQIELEYFHRKVKMSGNSSISADPTTWLHHVLQSDPSTETIRTRLCLILNLCFFSVFNILMHKFSSPPLLFLFRPILVQRGGRHIPLGNNHFLRKI